MIASYFLLFLFGQIGLAAPRSSKKPLVNRDSAVASDLPCLEVISWAQQGVYAFEASRVFDCISKVPFNAAVALRFLDYYNETLQFQSTLTFLKDPPQGYQQAPVDVHKELQDIKANIESGSYKSQYAFEAELRQLVSRMHDGHVNLDAGVLSAFTFASPYTLVSLSSDGQQTPRVYIQEDLVAASTEGYEASPVSSINGVDVVEYLTSLADLNSDGFVEQHADWNSLMSSPTQEILGQLSLIQRLTLYPGADLSFALENGTTVDTIWLAIYVDDTHTGPLTTPGDFYNFFVLGLLPANFDEEAFEAWWPPEYNVTLSSEGAPEPSSEPTFDCSDDGVSAINWCDATGGSIGAYPNDPVTVQDGDGFVTGYILDDISTGVLSIPSFSQNDRAEIAAFFDAIDDFIQKASETNTKRIIIDLQRNSGGLVLLALTTFQKFFPLLEPNTASRMRSHAAADILGTAYSKWWPSLPQGSKRRDAFAASEWVANTRINADTGDNFTSWAEYFGPVLDHADAFSKKQIYNLSDAVFDLSIFGARYNAWIDSKIAAQPEPWLADDILLITDGLCSSACSIFVELMTNMAGARTISMGGRPTTGPMQTASGTRGAAPYAAWELDSDYYWVDTLVKDRDAAGRLTSRADTGIFMNYASINLRDQMRSSDQLPLQFRYEPSDCRLYYTPKNLYNMSQLWHDAAAAVWEGPASCVVASTGFSSRTKEGRKDPPNPVGGVPAHYEVPQGPTDDVLTIALDAPNGLTDDSARRSNVARYKCGKDLSSGSRVCAQSSYVCATIPVTCGSVKTGETIERCLPSCDTYSNPLESGCVGATLASTPGQQPREKLRKRLLPGGGKPSGGSKPPAAPNFSGLFADAPVSPVVPAKVYNGYWKKDGNDAVQNVASGICASL